MPSPRFCSVAAINLVVPSPFLSGIAICADECGIQRSYSLSSILHLLKQWKRKERQLRQLDVSVNRNGIPRSVTNHDFVTLADVLPAPTLRHEFDGLRGYAGVYVRASGCMPPQ